MSVAHILDVRVARRRWFLPLAAALLAVACSGGVDTGGTGSEPQTVASGPVSGFGSILVGDVRFDESAANIVDDEGMAFGRGDLRLGMMVRVQAGPITAAEAELESSQASLVQFGSELLGAVQSVDTVAGSFVVLGQTVNVNLDTVFDGLAGGLAGLVPGQVVEVHGLVDRFGGRLLATRVESKTAAPTFKLKGTVSNLDTVARTFSLGGLSIGYADVPAADVTGLANGLPVHVRLLPVADNGRWLASRVYLAQRAFDDGVRVKLDGIVTHFVSLSDFLLDGVQVHAGGPSVVFKRGSSSQVADGVRLKIDGAMAGGVLVARKVDVKRPGGGDDSLKLLGQIQSLDAVAKTFVLRGVTVSFTNETLFLLGSAADLQAGAWVEVDGLLSSVGNSVVASRIKFDPQGGSQRITRTEP